MYAESDMIWKEAVVIYARCYSDICSEGLRKITETSIRIAASRLIFEPRIS
jgi:hypothetical protein